MFGGDDYRVKVPGSLSCVFSFPLLAIPSWSPGHFPWRMALETKIWDLSVLVDNGFLFRGLLNGHNRETQVLYNPTFI